MRQQVHEPVATHPAALVDEHLLTVELPQHLAARPAGKAGAACGLTTATSWISRSSGWPATIAATALRSAQIASP